MEDKQIKNDERIPKCGKCGREWSKDCPFVYFFNTPVCGECATKLHKKMNNWIQEAEV